MKEYKGKIKVKETGEKRWILSDIHSKYLLLDNGLIINKEEVELIKEEELKEDIIEKTNKIQFKTKSKNKKTIIEYEIDLENKEIKFKIEGNEIIINRLLKIILNETKIYEYKYERYSPYKIEREFTEEGHTIKLIYIDAETYKEVDKILFNTNKIMGIEEGEYKFFIPDLLEVCVERGILKRDKDGKGYELIKSIDNAMNNCEYLKNKPDRYILERRGFIVPKRWSK